MRPASEPQPSDVKRDLVPRCDPLQNLLSACNVPSISAGIIHEGRIVLTESYGLCALREDYTGSKTVPQAEGEGATIESREAPSIDMWAPGLPEQIEGYLPANSDTAYLTASCSKLFLACAAGILVDEGKLGWDDPISKHVPDFNPVRDPRIRNATIRHALSHQTGLEGQDLLLWGPHGTVLVTRIKLCHILTTKQP